MPDKDENKASPGIASVEQSGAKPAALGAGQAREAAVSSKPAGTTPDTGAALRSIYQTTIDEQIPADLLELLGKLG